MKYEVSIIFDGWTNWKNRTMMIFFGKLPFGKMFMESIDASSFLKTREKTFRACLRKFLKLEYFFKKFITLFGYCSLFLVFKNKVK